ncbi:MAG: OmpA family protein [Rhodocyclaceae bacterium]
MHAFYVVCADCAGPTPKTPFLRKDEPISKVAPTRMEQDKDEIDSVTDETPSDAAGSSDGILFTTRFVFGTARLSEADKQALLNVLPEFEQQRLFVAGFTDSVGPQGLNDWLALRRAQSVKAYLVEHGLNANDIEVSGRGKCCYLQGNDTAYDRAANRRAEIRLIAFSTDPTTQPGDKQP